jgi:hypothetical protein
MGDYSRAVTVRIISGAVLTLVTNIKMYHRDLSTVRNITYILTQYLSEETW